MSYLNPNDFHKLYNKWWVSSLCLISLYVDPRCACLTRGITKAVAHTHALHEALQDAIAHTNALHEALHQTPAP